MSVNFNIGFRGLALRGCLHLGGRSIFFVHVPPGAALSPRLRVRDAYERPWRGKAQTAGIARRFDNLVLLCHIGVTGKQMPSSSGGAILPC